MLGLGPFWRKPRQFDYKPFHFDPDKEARDQRRKELFGDNGSDTPSGDYKPGQFIRDRMRARRGYPTHKSEKQKVNVKRAVFALIILFAMAMYLILSD